MSILELTNGFTFLIGPGISYLNLFHVLTSSSKARPIDSAGGHGRWPGEMLAELAPRPETLNNAIISNVGNNASSK